MSTYTHAHAHAHPSCAFLSGILLALTQPHEMICAVLGEELAWAGGRRCWACAGLGAGQELAAQCPSPMWMDEWMSEWMRYKVSDIFFAFTYKSAELVPTAPRWLTPDNTGHRGPWHSPFSPETWARFLWPLGLTWAHPVWPVPGPGLWPQGSHSCGCQQPSGHRRRA